MKAKVKFITVSLDDIRLTGDNPRIVDLKSSEFAGLVESITAQGVVVPVHVRTDPAREKQYELLAGERRYRAAEKSGLREIPAIDHGDISDEAAFEITFAENFQREDLTTLEQGKAVSLLLVRYKDDFAAVAGKLGKSETWVRLRNCIDSNLIVEWKTAVSAGGDMGHFTAAHCGLIARFPAETQKALLHGMRNSYDDHPSVSGLEKRLAQGLRLIKKATFDTAGCEKCVKRSGCQPLLFSDSSAEKVGTGDKCLDPDCWEKRDIAASKAEFKEKCEKYPGLVGITKDYYFDRDEGKRLRKVCGKVLTKSNYTMCKKTDKGAVPAIMANGKGRGKIYYIKPKKDPTASPGKQKSAPLKTLRAELEKKRWAQTAGLIANKIGGLKFEDICTGDTLKELDEGVYRVLLMVSVYGCESVIGGNCQDYIEACMKNYASPEIKKKAAVLKEIASKVWTTVVNDLGFTVDTSGDESSRREVRLLAELFGLDIEDEYAKVCSEPEYAEPAEWTEKKVKGKKKSATEGTEDTEKVKSKKGKGKKAGKKIVVGTCRVCGCTDDKTCIGADGEPCHWVEKDLCSNCK